MPEEPVIPDPRNGNPASPEPRTPNPEPSAADPAQQSLADALRVSFGLLKVVMIVLLVAYLFSGVYQVPEQEAAVVTRFGQIVGDTREAQVKEPGWYIGLPFPIDTVIKVPTNERTIDLSQAFVYASTEAEQAQRPEDRQGRPLNPELDGSLITGDANIVHARFTTTYVVADPAAYVKNLADLGAADELVRGVVEQGIVHAVAAVSADDVIGGRFGVDRAKTTAQQVLNELDSGLEINSISINLPEMPLSVRDAYGLVSGADARRATLINDANKERTRLLGEAAGKAALPDRTGEGPLVSLIKEYELATAAEDAEELERLDRELSEAFRELAIQQDDTTYDIGGEAARIINEALIQKTQLVEQIKAEAQTVRQLSAAYDRDPALFKDLMWQSAAREIFTDDADIELWYVKPGSAVYIEMNRDPAITRARETTRLQAEREAARQ